MMHRFYLVCLWIVSALAYCYGMAGCFDLDPLRLGIYPGITGGLGAAGLMVAVAWQMKRRGEA